MVLVTHVGKFLVYLLAVRLLNVINNSPLLNVIKGNVSRVANDRFPSHCGYKVLYHFSVIFVKGKVNFFAQYTWGKPESKIVGIVKVCPCFVQ